MRTAIGRLDHKGSVEDCGDRHIPQKDDLCGYKRWPSGMSRLIHRSACQSRSADTPSCRAKAVLAAGRSE